MLTIGRQASNVYWIAVRRAPEDAAVRSSALMDIFGLGFLNCWLLKEAGVRAGADQLDPPGEGDVPLLRRFLGLHNPQSIYRRPPRMGFWRVPDLLMACASAQRPPPPPPGLCACLQPSMLAALTSAANPHQHPLLLSALPHPPASAAVAGPGRARPGPRLGRQHPPAACCVLWRCCR